MIHYNVLAGFRCLGADCPDTCCRGWEMPTDARQRARYAEKAPELLATIDPENGVMKRCGTGQQCAQLREGICSIHENYGEEFLGDACYFYPRFIHHVGDSYVMSGAPSCPEMLRLMLTEKAPFTQHEAVPARMPNHRHNLVPEGFLQAQVEEIHAQCMGIAGDAARMPEVAVDALLGEVLALAGQPIDKDVAAQSGDAHALYYALALTEAFGAPGISARLADVMAVMAQQLDCRFDRATHKLALGEQASRAYPMLLARWNLDARAALAPVLRRWLQAQIALTYFPFGGFSDASMIERAAVLVQRFATVRLALMCHVSPAGIPPDEQTVIRVIQAIARFMDHLADIKLTRMIHRDSRWERAERLRGLVRG